MNEQVKIFALGGLDEEGKNCTVVEIDGNIFVVGCGVRSPDKTLPGVDYVIPRYDYLLENKDRVKAYFLLHGHDDEIGALAYIYEEVPAPVYGTKVTLTMLETFTAHVKRKIDYDLHPVDPSSIVKVAGREFHFFHTAHNVADSTGLSIDTQYGSIVFTSDFVVENSAESSFHHDMNAIAQIGEKPVLALCAESVYAGHPGYTYPKYRLTPLISDAWKNAEGRIFISIYSQNLFNLYEIIKMAIASRRKIVFYDETSNDIYQSVRKASPTYEIPKANLANKDDILRLRDEDIVVVVAGFGTKLFHKMALLASGQNEDKRFKIKTSDTFIIASPADDNSEVEYTDAADTIFRTGCHVLNVSKKEFLQMQASEEDLKMMASILKPRYYIPVKGFYKEMLTNAMIALSMGIGLTHQNVFLLENGISVIFDETGGRVFDEKIPHGDLMIDGSGIGDISPDVLKDRQKLAEGVVIIACTFSKSKKMIIAGPDVQIRGFVFAKDGESIIREVGKLFTVTVNDVIDRGDPYYSIEDIKAAVYDRTLRAIRRISGREPMVLPLIIEVA